MKLPDYAKAIGISYTTAWRWWKANKLPHPARQTESGLIIVDYSPQFSSNKTTNRVAIYSRVSSSENKDNLNRQSERLTEYAIANGYQIVRNVKEIGSGLNDHRKQLESLLRQDDYDILLVEHKDRLARFGTNYLDVLLSRLGIKLEIVNLAENGKDELMQDLVAIVTSFAARLYGQRRASRKTEKIIAELKDGDSECS
ncbi:Resolvase domain protein [Oscillatoria nigro-viridis PCC 7112]|uniref:Resolvase domain protein n=1 Tax=Phormidium nigroviride PCC 7112 TaxID=179408 RepID=K9VIV6_9CYAN|nr:Resolvase domain protein [Oscillatoria nigro-viridis PCC 7112]